MIDNKGIKQLSTEQVLTSLKERVSTNNARLLLHSALVQIGRNGNDIETGVTLNEDESKSLCMVLIAAGGPAFQVGKNLYKSVLQ